jgi:hypothetical protein
MHYITEVETDWRHRNVPPRRIVKLRYFLCIPLIIDLNAQRTTSERGIEVITTNKIFRREQKWYVFLLILIQPKSMCMEDQIEL